jgi:hypothetical protein
MLDHAGVESIHHTVDRVACCIDADVTQPLVARHLAPQTGNRQASLPAHFHLLR